MDMNVIYIIIHCFRISALFTSVFWKFPVTPTTTLPDPVGQSSSSGFSVSSANPNKRQHCDEGTEKEGEAGDADVGVVNHNQPVLMAVYKDPATLCEKVCLCVDLPSGATEIIFALLGTGPATTKVVISYKWPQILYNVDGLFAKELEKKSMSATHPAIMALKLELFNSRNYVKDAPIGKIEVTLPIPVQTNPTTVTHKFGTNPEGVTILVAHLTAFHTPYTADKSEFKCQLESF